MKLVFYINYSIFLKLDEFKLCVKDMYALGGQSDIKHTHLVHPESTENPRRNWKRQVLILQSNQVWGLSATQWERQTEVSKIDKEPQVSREGTVL